MRFRSSAFFLQLSLVLLLMSQLFFNSASAEQKYYTVGVVPQLESNRIKNIWQPLLDRISEISGVRLKLKASHNIPVFETQFEIGVFDFAFMNPYHAIVANEKEGYQPLVRDKERNLYGIIVVRKDSSLQSVEELDGKTVAFPAPNSLGAAMIPRAEFKNKFNIKIKERYVNTHSSVFLNVLLRQVDAGGAVQKTLSLQPERIRSQLRILYKTAEVPPHPFVVHPRIDKKVQDKVTQAFLELSDTETGRKLLEKIPVYKIGKAFITDYDPLRQMGLSEFYGGR